MLTSDELSAFRGAFEELMPDECNLLTATTTRGTDGAPVETWGTATAKVACRLDPIRGREVIQGAALNDYHSYTLTLPYDTTITPAYRVEMNTYTFAVVEVDNGKSWALTKRARVERI